MRSFIKTKKKGLFINLNVKVIKKKYIVEMWLKKKRNPFTVFPYYEY